MSAEPDFTSENVERALYQLYYDPDINSKDAAQSWLTKAQRCNEAWQFAWQLLEQDKATEVQYFGASSLISKIGGAWNDIPESEVMVLRDKLFELLLNFSLDPEKRIVLTRLCVSLSSFVINCSVHGLWPTAIRDIIDKLNDNSDTKLTESQRFLALLEILTVLPEEYQTVRLETYKKGLFKYVLTSGLDQVLALLKNVFVNQSLKTEQNKVIRCLSSWIALGLPLSECTELLMHVLECIAQPDLFENSIECMLNTFCSPSIYSYPNTIKKLLPMVLNLRPMLLQAIKDEDAEMILGLTKLVCSLGENQPKLILETFSDPQYGLGVIHMVLDCLCPSLQYPTEENSSPISFTFWCSLQDELQAKSSQESIILTQHLHPFFYQLLDTLLQKASYPLDNSHNQWTGDEKEQHRIYRIDISDTLMYGIELLGIGVLVFIFNKLKTCLQQSLNSQGKPWQGIESCLFGIYSIVESLTECDTDIPCINELVKMLPNIEVNSLQLADTLIYTIGTLTEWLYLNPADLQLVMSIVLPCLHNSDLSMSTVLTLRRLTRECAEYMVPYASTLMQEISSVLVRGVLKNNEEAWLMHSAGHILSSISQEECLKHLQNLLVLQIHQLEALSKEGPSAPNKTSIIHILELLANLFCTLDRRKKEDGSVINDAQEEQPGMMILQQLAPIFKGILNHWVMDISVVKTLCDLYDKTIRSLVADFLPLVPSLCEMLSVVYQAYPHACVLDLTQQICLVFGADRQLTAAIFSLLQIEIQVTTKVFNSGAVQDHPDIAQSFLKLSSHIFRKQIDLLKNNTELTNLTNIFQCGLATIQMAETESIKSAANFFVDAISRHKAIPALPNVIESHLKELLKLVFLAIGGSAPRTANDNLADILFEIGQINTMNLGQITTELLSIQDFPCATVSSAKKTNFVSQMLKVVRQKRKLRDVVSDFGLVCRRLHGTDYVNS